MYNYLIIFFILSIRRNTLRGVFFRKLNYLIHYILIIKFNNISIKTPSINSNSNHFYLKILLFYFIIFSKTIFSQEEIRREYKTRVLFVIDASGSMTETWKGERKWDMAIHTLSKLIDSFQIKNKNIEIGVRLLGHQYHKSQNKCDDTKLEIPFSEKQDESFIFKKLNKIQPKGQTPLAYSLAQTEFDFKSDDNIQNLVVLITDGLETCDGNPCEISKKLREKNIFISPYIIGLGIDSLKVDHLKCIGKYIDVKDKKVFQTVMKSILSDISKKTTLEILFIDSFNNPINYYVPFSLVDSKNGKDYYNYIYSKKVAKGVDTLFINPQFNYNLKIHTNPPILVDTFKIIMGTHNIFTYQIISGTLGLINADRMFSNDYILLDSTFRANNKIENTLKYRHLSSKMNKIDILSHPEYRLDSISFYESSQRDFEIKNRSIVSFRINSNVEASIYDKKWNLVYSIPTEKPNQNVELISDEYFLLYKIKTNPSEKTITIPLILKPQQKYEYLLQ